MNSSLFLCFTEMPVLLCAFGSECGLASAERFYLVLGFKTDGPTCGFVLWI